MPTDGAAGPDLALVDGGPIIDLAAAPDLVSPRDLAGATDAGSGGQGANASINCGNGPCTRPKSVCCRALPWGAGTCVAPGDPCGQLAWFCDDPKDCQNPGDVCCIDQGSQCMPAAACAKAGGREGCQAMADCPGNQECCGIGPSPDYVCMAGPCPVSRRRHKEEIHYLDEAERRQAARALLSFRLSTWRYQRGADRGRHLGFLIDDVEPSPAVASDGEHVDLYGYTSLAVAALQEQARELEALRREVRALRHELSRSRRDVERRSPR